MAAEAATEGDVTTAWLDVRRSKRSELGREEEEKEVRIARGSRGCSAARGTTAAELQCPTQFQSEVARRNSQGSEHDSLTGRVWPRLRTNERTNERTAGSSLDSLSIASSNNKTDYDDDGLPFHLLQHGTYTSAIVSVRGWQSLEEQGF